jgi:hypothetical protein
MQIQCILAQEHGDLEAEPLKLAHLSQSTVGSRAQDKVGWLRDCQIPPLATIIKSSAVTVCCHLPPTSPQKLIIRSTQYNFQLTN